MRWWLSVKGLASIGGVEGESSEIDVPSDLKSFARSSCTASGRLFWEKLATVSQN